MIQPDAKKIRILFMGTPQIAANVLERLLDDGYNIVGLVAQEDKQVGRKRLVLAVPTKVVARGRGIPSFQPHRIRQDISVLDELKPELILTLAYGQIVPDEVLNYPKYGCLNLHGSILPKYRGAAPIQRAIMDGEKETGITLMQMVSKMDAGKMYAVEKVRIDESDDYNSLSEKLADAAYKCVSKNLQPYLDGILKGEEQDEEKVTFADKILPEDEVLSKELSVKEFINKVRGLCAIGPHVIIGDKTLKIFKASKKELDMPLELGQIYVKKGIFIKLKDGLVSLDEVQLQGKNKMDGRSFASGAQSLNGQFID